MSITIARAADTPHDRDRAWAIIDAYCEEIGVIVRDTPAYFDSYFQSDSGIWLALTPADVVVGCIVLRPIAVDGVAPGQAAEVKRLYVLPEARGQRVSERLLAALEAYAATQGYGRLYLDTKDDLLAAIRFYNRQGYEACERYNDNPQATIFMVKAIGN